MKDKEYGVKLNLDIKEFKSKIQESEKAVSKFSDKMQERIDNIYEKQFVKLREPIKIEPISDKKGIKELTKDLEKLNKERDELLEKKKDIEDMYKSVFGLEKEFKEMTISSVERFASLAEKGDPEGERGLKRYEEGQITPVSKSVYGAYGKNYDKVKSISQELTKINTKEALIKNRISEIEKGTEEVEEDVEETGKKGTNIIGIFQNFDGSIKKAVSSIKRFSLSLLGIQSLYSALSKATHAYMNTDETLHNKMQASWIALGAVMAPIIEKLIELFQRFVGYVNVFYKAFTGKDLIGKALKNVEKQTNKNTKAQKELNKELANFDEITNLSFDTGSNDIDTGTDVPSIADALKEMQDMKLNPEIVAFIENLANKLKDVWQWIKDNKEEILLFGGVFASVLAGLKIGDTIKKLSEMFSLVETASGATGAFGLWGLAIGGIVADLTMAYELGQKIVEAMEADEQNQEQQLKLADSRLNTMETIEEQIKKVNKMIEEGLTQDEYGRDLQARKNELIQESNQAYDRFNKDLEDGKRYTKEQVEEMNKLKRKIEDITNSPHRAEIEFNPKLRKGWLYDFGNEFANGLQSLTKFDLKGVFKGLHFAKGNVAYKPTVAEFGEYAGASTNPEITAPQNMMRQTLFEALEQALPLVNTGGNQEHGDIILNVNGKEFARATYSDYQSEARRMGSSSVAIRRS